MGTALLTLMFGFFPALGVALAVGLPLAFGLRRVTNQWWHLLAFGVAGLLVAAVPNALSGELSPDAVLVSVALAAVVGRAVLWRRFRPWVPVATTAARMSR